MILIKNKRLNVKEFSIRSLRKVFGVGKFSSREITKRLGYNHYNKMPKLSEFTTFNFFLIKFWLSFFILERDLLRKNYLVISINKELKTYQGIRYSGFLPIHGRTHTNAKTCKKVYGFYLKKFRNIL